MKGNIALMLDRFAIDDGRHLPEFVIDEDASSVAGSAQFRVTCSCGRMPEHLAGTRGRALAAHLAHVGTRLGPSRGPAWLPVGARLAILFVAMMALWGACLALGHVIIRHYGLTGGAAPAARVGFTLAGLALAMGLMVAARRYIAPTRA